MDALDPGFEEGEGGLEEHGDQFGGDCAEGVVDEFVDVGERGCDS